MIPNDLSARKLNTSKAQSSINLICYHVYKCKTCQYLHKKIDTVVPLLRDFKRFLKVAFLGLIIPFAQLNATVSCTGNEMVPVKQFFPVRFLRSFSIHP